MINFYMIFFKIKKSHIRIEQSNILNLFYPAVQSGRLQVPPSRLKESELKQ